MVTSDQFMSAALADVQSLMNRTCHSPSSATGGSKASSWLLSNVPFSPRPAENPQGLSLHSGMLLPRKPPTEKAVPSGAVRIMHMSSAEETVPSMLLTVPLQRSEERRVGDGSRYGWHRKQLTERKK